MELLCFVRPVKMKYLECEVAMFGCWLRELIELTGANAVNKETIQLFKKGESLAWQEFRGD